MLFSRRLLVLAAVATPVLLAACAVPTGAKVADLPPLARGASELVVYRPIDQVALYNELRIDGQGTGWMLKNGGVALLPVVAGAHAITVAPTSFPSSRVDVNTLALDLRPDQRRFVRLRLRSAEERRISMAVSGTYLYALEEVDAATAAAEIRGLNYLR
jgi:hypothetical protein